MPWTYLLEEPLFNLLNRLTREQRVEKSLYFGVYKERQIFASHLFYTLRYCPNRKYSCIVDSQQILKSGHHSAGTKIGL